MSQEFRGWLKVEEVSNIYPIFVTEEVSQEFRGWLKLVADLNIEYIAVTLEVFQLEKIGRAHV